MAQEYLLFVALSVKRAHLSLESLVTAQSQKEKLVISNLKPLYQNERRKKMKKMKYRLK